MMMTFPDKSGTSSTLYVLLGGRSCVKIVYNFMVVQSTPDNHFCCGALGFQEARARAVFALRL